MLYEEYEELRTQYKTAQENYAELLEEKESLFLRTQPSAVAYDKDSVSIGSPKDVFADYVGQIECVDARLKIAEGILNNRHTLLKHKEEELRKSKDIYNVIYVYRYIDGVKAKHIVKRVPYSRSQVYNILNKIKMDIERARN